jgi:hypothetical protein
MRKLTVLATLAAVLIAAPMFAVTRHLRPEPNATFANGLAPTTTNNNDTCDIGHTPAATLLLPYFNVDISGGNTANTIFSIVNTSRFPQIAHVVLWTDWSFAALDFNIFLTGFDVQSISMRDIFVNGQVAPNPASGGNGGTSSTGSVNGPGTGTTPTLATVQGRNSAGGIPASNTGNPNFTGAVTSGAGTGNCVNQPGPIPSTLLADLQKIFTTGAPGTIIGTVPGSSPAVSCPTALGGTHTNAIGYITIDVASNCSTNLPGPTYFSSDVLFDNVLTGDWEQIVPGTSGGLTNASGGSPLVHIRAIPEGGVSGSTPGTNLPFTFYDRYTGIPTAQAGAGIPTGRTIDRRQPLPSTFAARWIQGGSGGFNTNFIIWREGLGSPDGTSTACTATVPSSNSALLIRDEVRFDEFENAVGLAAPPGQFSPTTGPLTASLPETSSTPTSASLPFPPAITVNNPSGVAPLAGWMFLNLANNGTGAVDCRLTFQRGVGVDGVGFGPALCERRTTQNWVVVNMQASPSFSALFDATWLGNGCTPAPAAGAVIGTASTQPASGTGNTALVCPPPFVVPAVTNTQCAAGTQPPTPTP